MSKFTRYIEELKGLYSRKNRYYSRTGRRLLTWEKIQDRLTICETCDKFDGRRCNLCGCCVGATESHFNKLAFPTAECPDGKWTPEP